MKLNSSSDTLHHVPVRLSTVPYRGRNQGSLREVNDSRYGSYSTMPPIDASKQMLPESTPRQLLGNANLSSIFLMALICAPRFL